MKVVKKYLKKVGLYALIIVLFLLPSFSVFANDTIISTSSMLIYSFNSSGSASGNFSGNAVSGYQNAIKWTSDTSVRFVTFRSVANGYNDGYAALFVLRGAYPLSCGSVTTYNIWQSGYNTDGYVYNSLIAVPMDSTDWKIQFTSNVSSFEIYYVGGISYEDLYILKHGTSGSGNVIDLSAIESKLDNLISDVESNNDYLSRLVDIRQFTYNMYWSDTVQAPSSASCRLVQFSGTSNVVYNHDVRYYPKYTNIEDPYTYNQIIVLMNPRIKGNYYHFRVRLNSSDNWDINDYFYLWGRYNNKDSISLMNDIYYSLDKRSFSSGYYYLYDFYIPYSVIFNADYVYKDVTFYVNMVFRFRPSGSYATINQTLIEYMGIVDILPYEFTKIETSSSTTIINQTINEFNQSAETMESFEQSWQSEFDDSFNDVNDIIDSVVINDNNGFYILSSINWLSLLIQRFYEASGIFYLIILFPLLIGLALFVIGRAARVK